MKKLLASFKSAVSSRDRLYHWSGISRLGEPKFGQIRAKNRQEVRQKLRHQALIIKTINHQIRWPRSIKHRDIAFFTDQLSTLMTANITLIISLQILANNQSNAQLLTVLTKIQLDVESGVPFSQALRSHPLWFDSVVCSLAALGEQSGTLASLMRQVAQYQAKNAALKQHLQTILIYPCAIILVASVVSCHLLMVVVPQFQSLFKDFKATLPLATRTIIALSQLVKTNGRLGLVLLLTFMAILRASYCRFSIIKQIKDRWLFKLPVIGQLCLHSYLARSFYALAIATQASLPLIDALQWVAEATENLYVKQTFLTIRLALTHGDSIKSAVYCSQLFPELAVQMLSLGEETGTLPQLLMELATYYNHSVEQSIQRLSRLIEPALMIILGVIIGGLIIALYLPIIKLGTLI